MTPPRENGSGWRSWLIGALFILVLGFGSVAWSGHEGRIGVLEADAKPLRERITTLEAQRQFIVEQIAEMRQQLNRIEARQIQGRQVLP